MRAFKSFEFMVSAAPRQRIASIATISYMYVNEKERAKDPCIGPRVVMRTSPPNSPNRETSCSAEGEIDSSKRVELSFCRIVHTTQTQTQRRRGEYRREMRGYHV